MRNLLLAMVGLVLVAVAGVALLGMKFLNSVPSENGVAVIFEIAPGASLRAVARNLEESGLVTGGEKFYWYARFRKAENKIRVGEYAMRTDMKPADVLAVVMSGKSVARPITVPEGLNVFEIAEIFEKAGLANKDEFMKLVKNAALVQELLGESLPSLEGYLFPETYKVTKYTGARALIKMMVDRFLLTYKEVPSHAMTRHQLVTLASIVEKETGAPEERPLISSVFHNRLLKGMRLQTDPTIIYGLYLATGQWNKNISRVDLTNDGAYNTYTRSGLPPGPISNPGREALFAAALPASTPYLYFVSRNDGTHVFSETYAAHDKAVKSFQLNRKAREGKSWRDLNKKRQPER